MSFEVDESRWMLVAVTSSEAFPSPQMRAPVCVADVGEEPGYLPSGNLSIDGPVTG